MKIHLAEQLGCFLIVFFGREALFAARTPVALLNVSEIARFVEEDSFLAQDLIQASDLCPLTRTYDMSSRDLFDIKNLK